MFKLVIVGGKLRGKEFVLQEGDNSFGREPDCDFPIEDLGVSKKHFNINVHGESAYIEDLGSSNGTFLNGKLVEKSSIADRDKVAIPNMILQLVYVKEKKVVITKKVPKVKTQEIDDDEDNVDEIPPMPESLAGKFLHIFRYRLMPLLYGFNKEYEWRYMVGILIAVFITTIIGLTIFPVLQTSKNLLVYETLKRGTHYADEISRLNARALEQNKLDAIDTKFLENEEGIHSYELFDFEGRIYRPIGKINEYISDPFSVTAFNIFKKSKKKDTFKQLLSDGQIGIAKKILAYNQKRDAIEPVGIIAIRFAPRSLAQEAATNSKAFLEAWATSAIIAIIFFGFIYYLTIKPIDVFRHEIEQVQRGKKKEIEATYLMSELSPLISTVNSLLARVRELQSDGDDSEFQELEDDGIYVKMLEEILKGSEGGAIVLDSQKVIHFMNPQVEDIVGFRESSSQGSAIDEVARDQGFAATVLSLCDQSANSGGDSYSEVYELSGRQYEIFVSAIIGKDSFAKAFYITFVQDS